MGGRRTSDSMCGKSSRNNSAKNHLCSFTPNPSLYWFARAAVTKCHRRLNSKHLLSPSPGGWKSPMWVSAGPVSPEASLLGLQMTIFYLGPHTDVPLCASVSQSPLKDTSCVGLGPTLLPILKRNQFFKDSVSKCSPILSCTGG